jgi:hypothetical protein
MRLTRAQVCRDRTAIEGEQPMTEQEHAKMLIRDPRDIKRWLEQEARRNAGTADAGAIALTAEIIERDDGQFQLGIIDDASGPFPTRHLPGEQRVTIARDLLCPSCARAVRSSDLELGSGFQLNCQRCDLTLIKCEG